MSKTPGYSSQIEMGALKKPAQFAVDLMRPGNGTPWEDRGSLGAVSAYFKTVAKSMTSPGLLMDHIRRPETVVDSVAFAWISVTMWVAGVVIWNIIWRYAIFPGLSSTLEMEDETYYWLTAGGQAVLVGAGWFLWLHLGPRMYKALAGNELKNATPSLVYNCFAYSLGPSVLAVIPIFGQGLALVWIFGDLVAAGKKRLYMKGSNAFINALLITVLFLVGAVVAYFVIKYVWVDYLEMGGIKAKEAPRVIPNTNTYHAPLPRDAPP